MKLLKGKGLIKGALHQQNNVMYKFRSSFYKCIVLDLSVNFNYMYYTNNISMIRFWRNIFIRHLLACYLWVYIYKYSSKRARKVYIVDKKCLIMYNDFALIIQMTILSIFKVQESSPALIFVSSTTNQW